MVENLPEATPWQQRPDEGPKQFAAFEAFLKLREKKAAEESVGVSKQTYLAWSERFEWV